MTDYSDDITEEASNSNFDVNSDSEYGEIPEESTDHSCED